MNKYDYMLVNCILLINPTLRVICILLQTIGNTVGNQVFSW